MILREQWEEILADNELDELDLRDNRYHQVCMAMHGNDRGSKYYTLETDSNIVLISQLTLGHPYDKRCEGSRNILYP